MTDNTRDQDAGGAATEAGAPQIMGGRFAALTNMALAYELMVRALDRPRHLVGLVVLHGYSGLGKSTAAAYLTAQFNAVYVEARDSWTKKHLLVKIAEQLGIDDRGTIPVLAERVAEGLANQDRPLIVDEADHLVKKGAIELIRGVLEESAAPGLLIGEEHLPEALKEYERIDNRVIAFEQARPASRDDACLLRDLYCKRVTVADDLVEMILEETHGCVRRICVNLERVQEIALAEGQGDIDRAWWGGRPFFTGRADHGRAS